MYYQNFQSIPVFGDNHPKRSLGKSKTQKIRTTIERQKECRYKVLCRRRFPDSELWDDTSDETSGYLSDESSHSHSSVQSLEHISHLEVLTAFLNCQPLPECETILNTLINTSMEHIRDNGSDFDAINQIVTNFFDFTVLNKASTLIGCKGIRRSTQVRLLKMYEELVDKEMLSHGLIQNLVNSSMVPKMIQIVVSGNESLVSITLEFLLMILERNSSTALLGHILNAGLIDALTVRTELLRWKTTTAHSWDLKNNRRQRQSEENFSSEAKKFFRHFAKTVSQLSAIDMEDNLRVALMSKMIPLLNRLLACPDTTAVTSVIRCLQMSVESRNQIICSLIIENFAQKFFAVVDSTDRSVAYFALLQLFKTLMDLFPQLFYNQNFGDNLINCLERIVDQKRDNHKLETEVISIIASISQWININSETIQRLSHRLIHLLVIFSKSGDRFNREFSIETIETILCKHSFQSFANLFKVFDIRGQISQLMVSNDSHQKIGLNIVAHILNCLTLSFDDMPEEVERVKQLLFGKSSDLYYCLEKLSFKTTNNCLSNRANQLLKQIDGNLSDDEDSRLVPGINQNGFLFGPTL